MRIDFENLLKVAERLAAPSIYQESAVTIGEARGKIFRLVVMDGMVAEDEDCAETPKWAHCVSDA